MRKFVLPGIGFAVTAVVVACQTGPEPRETLCAAEEGRGAFLYARYCSTCHGKHGAGDGLASGLLDPPARNFGTGLFSLVSTKNGVPTDADLAHVLRRGVPGSSMPSFAWLGEDDIRSLVTHVRDLTKAEMAHQMAAASGGTLAEAAAVQQVEAAFRPGEPVVAPRIQPPTPAVLARGKAVYLRRCAACHGEQGTGWQPIVKWSGRKRVHWARDFTTGILKGGIQQAELAKRIQAGMPGSAMPPIAIENDADLAAVLTYVQTLAPSAVADRLVQRQETIRVKRRDAGIPAAPTSPIWADVPPVEVVLSPMRWRTNAIVHAELRAVHDGKEVAFQVSWEDPTRNEPGFGESKPSDRVALQFSDDPEASFFGMGSRRSPVTIWYWQPRPARQTAGELDLVQPHRTLADIVPIVRRAGSAQAVTARGNASAREFPGQDRRISARAQWERGRWTVVFWRDLAPGEGSKLQLNAANVRLALAIWDGQASTSPADKSFTIWHRLQFE